MMKRRLLQLRMGIIFFIFIILATLALLNLLSYRHYWRFDTTASGRFTLSPQTIKILEALPAKLQMTLFDKPSTVDRKDAEDLMSEYRYYSRLVETRLVDPDQEPREAKHYNVQTYGTLVLEYQGRQEKLEQVTEELLTNAIVKITRTEKKKIYFLEGHGEKDIETHTKEGYPVLVEALEKQNYQVEKLLLMRAASVPEDCAVLVLAGPQKPLLEVEEQQLDIYLKRGGSALFLLDPPPGIGLTSFLDKWGIKVGTDIVVDKLSRIFGGDYFMPVITEYLDHPITKGFNTASFLPVTRTITPASKPPASITVLPLAKTSQGSWAETRLEEQKCEYNEGEDRMGPLDVAVVATMTITGETITPDATSTTETEPSAKKKEKMARLVVVGDSDFASNTYLNLSGNRDLILNIISWLAQEEGLISIRPRDEVPRVVTLTEAQIKGLFYLTVLILPGLFLVIGSLVWLRRRYR